MNAERWIQDVDKLGKEAEVGSSIVHFAGAPATGRIVYEVTKIENGEIYGVVRENTVEVPELPFYM